MIEHRHTVDGDGVVIHVVEHEDDLEQFEAFINANLGCLGLDSETTGLNIYQDDFRCRVVQFGNHREAYVIPVERGGRYEEAVIRALEVVERFIIHNAAFDLQVLDRCLGVKMEDMWPCVTDTKIIAHLVDPRARKEGGSGHSLEDLLRKYVDAEAADNVKGLMNMLRLRHKTTSANIWKIIPFDDPDYQLYSGMDPIFAARLMSKLAPLVPTVSEDLIPYEHRIAEVCSYMERQGFLLDVEYSEKLSETMLRKRDHYAAKANVLYGLENVNSTEQCADALERTGVKIKGRTPSGKRQVNEDLLDQLKDEGNDLALSISEAKKWGKWEKTWVRKFLDSRDSQDRCHAGINPLQARTSRMSITGIPAQTLPAGDWMVRRCFLSDPGQLIASVDYQTQELRVLAALSGDETMIRAFQTEADLHQMTADAAGVDRKVGKMANFLTVYGGGAGTLSKNARIPFTVAKQVVQAFERTYPGVAKLSAKLQQEAAGTGAIVTPKGRRLPVDADRGYSALNYCVELGTPILTADLRHVPAETVEVGDKLIGFDEHTNSVLGRGNAWRRFRTSEVEAASIVVKPSVVVRDVKGRETVCSSDHLWLVRRPDQQPRYAWVRADELGPGDLLLSVGTWEYDTSHTGGYLAGLYDGEGSMSGRAGGKKQTSLIFSQNTGLVMDAFVESMNKLGLRHSYYKCAPNSTSTTDTVAVQGVPNILRVLGTLRPKRFIGRAWEIYEGAAIVGGRQMDEIPVESVETVGDRELVSIQTSTRTLVANGYLSHNCIQSVSRDVTCGALLRLHDAGFTPYMRLVIHDEVLASVPEEKAEWGAQRIGELMVEDMGSVVIGTDPDVYGFSWGHGYMSDEDKLTQTRT